MPVRPKKKMEKKKFGPGNPEFDRIHESIVKIIEALKMVEGEVDTHASENIGRIMELLTYLRETGQLERYSSHPVGKKALEELRKVVGNYYMSNKALLKLLYKDKPAS